MKIIYRLVNVILLIVCLLFIKIQPLHAIQSQGAAKPIEISSGVNLGIPDLKVAVVPRLEFTNPLREISPRNFQDRPESKKFPNEINTITVKDRESADNYLIDNPFNYRNVNYIILLDDSFIYSETPVSVGRPTHTIYRHYFNDNKTVEIGSLPGGNYPNAETSALVNDMLYFYFNDSNRRVLAGIDLNSNTIKEIASDMIPSNQLWPSRVQIWPFGDYILKRNYIRNDINRNTVYLEVLDVENNRVIGKSNEYYIDSSIRAGTGYLQCTVYNRYIYILLEEWLPDNKQKLFIHVFDKNFKLMRTINMDAVTVHSTAPSVSVSAMNVYENFVYLHATDSFSSITPVIGIIENNSFKPLAWYYFEYQCNPHNNNFPFIYTIARKVDFGADKNRWIFIDTDKNLLNAINFSLKDGYIFSGIINNGENVLIFIINEQKWIDDIKNPHLLYHIPISKLAQVVFD